MSSLIPILNGTPEPTATFYIWANISGLPPPLNDSLVFLEECAKNKIICVVSSPLFSTPPAFISFQSNF